MNHINLPIIFGLVGILLSFLLVFIGAKKQTTRKNRAAIFMYMLAVVSFLSALLNFIPTKSANNIRVDLVFVDFMFYPIVAIIVVVNLVILVKGK